MLHTLKLSICGTRSTLKVARVSLDLPSSVQKECWKTDGKIGVQHWDLCKENQKTLTGML